MSCWWGGGQIGADLPSMGPSLLLSLSQGCNPAWLSVEACVWWGEWRERWAEVSRLAEAWAWDPVWGWGQGSICLGGSARARIASCHNNLLLSSRLIDGAELAPCDAPGAPSLPQSSRTLALLWPLWAPRSPGTWFQPAQPHAWLWTQGSFPWCPTSLPPRPGPRLPTSTALHGSPPFCSLAHTIPLFPCLAPCSLSSHPTVFAEHILGAKPCEQDTQPPCISASAGRRGSRGLAARGTSWSPLPSASCPSSRSQHLTTPQSLPLSLTQSLGQRIRQWGRRGGQVVQGLGL